MTTGQIVTGKPGLMDEYQKGLVMDEDGSSMLISITEHEFDESMVGEEIWVEKEDYRVLDNFGNAPVYDAPKTDMNQARLLGLVR
jgi:hypothetical protein